MAKNSWIDSQASALTSPLNQLIYASRLLGQESDLVLHGGGNTSVKTQAANLFGEQQDVLYVKGSGRDLATIDESGFSPLALEPLRRLLKVSKLSDADMTDEFRKNLLNGRAPTPSVEALMHAFLPHRFIFHTHADAILCITNQPDGEARAKTVFGSRMIIVPYKMPGFELAKTCFDLAQEYASAEGLILLKHGIVTFGENAKQAYSRMIEMVQLAEEYNFSRAAAKKTSSPPRAEAAQKAAWMKAIRACYLKHSFPCILAIEDSEASLRFLRRPDLSEVSQQGPLTSDHVIRTKRVPLLVDTTQVRDLENHVQSCLNRYEQDYKNYLQRNRSGRIGPIDAWPRIWLLPNIGMITAGATAKDANVARDIYIHTASVIEIAQGMGSYQSLDERDVFDVESWAPQQAKLEQRAKPGSLIGKVCIITGGVSGIGLATAQTFLSEGACVFILDIQQSKFAQAQEKLTPLCHFGNFASFLQCDVTDRVGVKKILESIISEVGGIDIAVINAGIFTPSSLVENISDEHWQQSLSVNLTGSFNVAAETIHWMKEQGYGGDIVFIASKNVPAPGKEAAAYSVSKAGQTQLARICALEAGGHGVRVNILHPHLIFDTGVWTDEVIAKRAKAYGMSPEQYKRNNLLKTELCSHDVAKAALALVNGSFSKTTGAQIPVDGGSDRTL
ncbi:MAG: bifunctional aldolase/short-chain dehydrogenase [Deltaproteobacteria bacterium]|nr:bifunctional aldolase/short-chain dehydrogenase [Deltaproteobacteria bacterium]